MNTHTGHRHVEALALRQQSQKMTHSLTLRSAQAFWSPVLVYSISLKGPPEFKEGDR